MNNPNSDDVMIVNADGTRMKVTATVAKDTQTLNQHGYWIEELKEPPVKAYSGPNPEEEIPAEDIHEVIADGVGDDPLNIASEEAKEQKPKRRAKNGN